MSRRIIVKIEIDEVIYRWIKLMPKKRIARTLGMSINTVRKIINQAETLGFKQESKNLEQLPVISGQIKKSFEHSSNKTSQAGISLHHDIISQLLGEKHITAMQIKRLLEEKDVSISYSSLRRYISKHFPKKSNSTVVLHTQPGQEAQVDFGAVGTLFDPIKECQKKTYVFVMVLSYSRYRFIRFVFHQDVKTWIDCHMRAFILFGGVPATIVLDNLKAGVIKPNIYDPTINRAYAECERYYGFVVDPTKVRTPQHKGKVERNMPIVRQQVLAGRKHEDIQAANRYAEHWCRYEISQRVTRTTGETPWDRFIKHEQTCLLQLPNKPYECPSWHSALVHKDHHVVIEGSFYSVDTAYIGQTVWVRVGYQDVQIFSNDERIKFHARATRKGTWVTDQQDYPESARKFLDLDKEKCSQDAKVLGKNVFAFIKPLLSPFSRQQQRKILAIFRLKEEYSANRLDAACRHALSFDNNRIDSLKNILKKGLEKQIKLSNQEVCTQGAYLRDPDEFVIYH